MIEMEPASAFQDLIRSDCLRMQLVGALPVSTGTVCQLGNYLILAQKSADQPRAKR